MMSQVYTHHFKTPNYTGSVSVNTGHFIGGKFVGSSSDETIDVINPFDGKVITKVASGTIEDVNAAVAAARAAFKSSWGLKVPGYDRGRLLSKLADIIEANADELAALEALDAGKQWKSVKTRELAGALAQLRYFSGWADKNHGQTIETNEAKFAYTRHQPIGVCALIAPWNFPLVTAIGKMAPALATGNTVVLKPSEFTPLSAMKIAEYVIQAGFPPGTVNIVTGYGPVVGQALAEHRDVDKISFTGSTLVGRKIMESSGKSNLKRVTLELGGKSPTIIFDDADLEQAIKWTAAGIFFHSGQVCVAGSRIFVQEGIYDKFIKAFSAVAESFKPGSGFDDSGNQDPLVSELQLKRVLGYIESGKADGATVLTGGERIGDTGYYVKPTVFTDVDASMKIIREEIFGPVAALIKFKEEQEVIDMANDTVYGLSSVVFTENISRAIRVAHALEAGQTFINSSSTSTTQVPFGGVKQSGFGKELGQAALEAFTTVKAVHVNLGVKL